MIKKHNNFIEKFKSFFGGYDNTSNIVPPNTNYIGSPSRNNKLQNLNTANSNKKKSKKVLIIDEIDVLFNKNYYGDTFNQSIDLKDDSIVKLFWFIWKNKENITPEIIENSDEFNVVIQRFKPL